MSIRRKIAAAAGALALIALVPTPAKAQTVAFAVEANRDIYNVSCRSGASFGTAPIRLRVTDDDTTANRWVATWGNGDTGEIVMTAEDRYFSASSGATFPCPALSGAANTGQITLMVQAYAGEAKIGDAVPKKIVVRRVGSASGASGVGVGGPFVEVLGLRLGDPNGPAPIGGIRTGAGGSSAGSNNLLLPLGAGVGFAGLAAAVVIRRRRCPTV